MSALGRILKSDPDAGDADEPARRNAARHGLYQRLLDGSDAIVNETRLEALSQKVQALLNIIVTEQKIALPEQEIDILSEHIAEELLEFGPLAVFLDDPTIVDIMVIGPSKITIAPRGRQQISPLEFRDEMHLREVIDHIVEPLGYSLDREHPLLEFRLPDGSRLNAVIPPVAVDGTVVTIRRMAKAPLNVQNIIDYGVVTAEAMEFLRACVLAGLNVLISGSGSGGKTTLLNILCGFIPDDERIITVEHNQELILSQPHLARLEARRPDAQGLGEVTVADLLAHAQRMMPDRIIVGEIRGGEASNFLFMMNTGSSGAMATMHANSPRDALAGLETRCQINMDYPVRAIRQEIASTIHVIVQIDRLRDGSRKVTRVCEVQGMEGDVVTLFDLFVFEQIGVEGPKILGRIQPTGLRPKNLERIADMGIYLPDSIFGIEET